MLATMADGPSARRHEDVPVKAAVNQARIVMRVIWRITPLATTRPTVSHLAGRPCGGRNASCITIRLFQRPGTRAVARRVANCILTTATIVARDNRSRFLPCVGKAKTETAASLSLTRLAIAPNSQGGRGVVLVGRRQRECAPMADSRFSFD